MPTNANTFNSRVTSEALEAKFRQVFPSQGGAELPQDLFASGVLQPVIDFSSVAEGSVLPANLQTAMDFAVGESRANASTVTAISNTGFWRVRYQCMFEISSGNAQSANIRITDGVSNKNIWSVDENSGTSNHLVVDGEFNVFLNTGQSLVIETNRTQTLLVVNYRQIANVNGTLVNPLGFTFS